MKALGKLLPCFRAIAAFSSKRDTWLTTGIVGTVAKAHTALFLQGLICGGPHLSGLFGHAPHAPCGFKRLICNIIRLCPEGCHLGVISFNVAHVAY
jgi:hypothetical protein